MNEKTLPGTNDTRGAGETAGTSEARVTDQTSQTSESRLVHPSEHDVQAGGPEPRGKPAPSFEADHAAPRTYEAPPPDDLTQIRGIDKELAGALHAMDVTRFRQIAAWSAADVAAVAERLGLGKRIAREGWIEQAAVLATGRLTRYAMAQGLKSPEPEPPTEITAAAQPAPAVEDGPDLELAPAATFRALSELNVDEGTVPDEAAGPQTALGQRDKDATLRPDPAQTLPQAQTERLAATQQSPATEHPAVPPAASARAGEPLPSHGEPAVADAPVVPQPKEEQEQKDHAPTLEPRKGPEFVDYLVRLLRYGRGDG